MALPEAGVELIAKGAQEFVDALGRARDAQGRFVAGAKDAEAQTGGGGGSFSAIGMAAANFIGTMAVQAFNAATQAASDFIGGTLTVAADYESTMNRFASVTGDAVTDAGMSMEDFNKLFLEMGAQTQFSAQQAADAAVELAKGGIDPTTIAASGLEGALALAAAGELDLAQAAEITAKQLGVWGDAAKDANHVADLFAQAANASTVNVDDLALGMSNVGGTAKTMGLTFDDTVQVLAQIAPGFSNAATAGTGLNAFLLGLRPTTDKAREAMVDLGLATEDGRTVFEDAQGNFVGVTKAAELLHGALEGMTSGQQIDAFNALFGRDGLQAAALIAEGGAAGFQAMGASMAGAGSAADQAAERNKGLNFAIESLKGSWETIQIVLGTALLPLLTEFLNTAVIPLANAILAFAQDNMPQFQAALANAQGAIQPLIDVFLNLVGYFGTIGTESGKSKDALTELPKPIQPIIKAAGDLMAAFQESMPMIQTYIEDMKRTAVNAAETLGPDFSDRITSILNTLTEFWSAHGEEVMAIVNFLFRTITVVVGGAMLLILGVIDAGLKFITGIWDAGSKLLQGDWQGAWDSMTKYGEDMINTIGKVVADLIDFAIKTFSGGTLELDENWRTSLEGLGTAVVDMRDGFLKTVGDFIGAAVKAAAKAGQDFLGVGENIVKGMITGVEQAAKGLANAAAAAAASALDAAKRALGIQSPSTAFAEEVGEPSGKGFIVGLQNMQRDMARAAGAIFGSTVQVSANAASLRARGYSDSGSPYTYAPSWNLSVNTRESFGSIRRDFGVMELLAG